jgi:ribosomal protein S6
MTTTKTAVPATAKTPSYELLFIFPGSLKESERKAAQTKWKAEVSKLGKILNEAVWENRPLAYPINKEKTGTYVIWHFEAADTTKIPELDNALRLDPQVIRYMLLKTPKTYKFQEYTAEDLEHDYSKVNRDVFNEDEAAKPAVRAKPAKQPAAKATKQLDDVLADLN